MYLKPPKASTDPALRSLLQKAVRRGYLDIVRSAILLLEKKGDKTWLRSRTFVITFEECWPLANQIVIKGDIASKIDTLLKVTSSFKQKDAAGLGALAYAYMEGDKGMLDCIPNIEQLKYVAGALQRPNAFFDWIIKQSNSKVSEQIIINAQKSLPAATWQWDKASIIAGALLSISNAINLPETLSENKNDFPYWVALDKHTPSGKIALRKIAKDLKISYREIIWSSFYCESARVNSLYPSNWWEAEKTWRLRRAGLTIESAEKLWLNASKLLENYLYYAAVDLKKSIENTDQLSSNSSTRSSLF